ncbi:hypothetical protein N0V90_009640 [Kalmusia sp. IMI 367209]|nr:hypothetical protein N0V90_009640 [Kalmusia sp. IMI 367209]
MRLLNVHTKKLQAFYTDIPAYAILSHTWLNDEDEVTFSQIQVPSACKDMPGYRKIQFLCDQAAKDGLEYAWIVRNTSSSELSEAINSMFRWYQLSEICYVYLADVKHRWIYDIFKSRWWTRSWTLQEFLASSNVVFYDADWRWIGRKVELASAISKRMGIDKTVLRDPQAMFSCSVAQRMSWAALRSAKRTEDIAYALLGIFDVNMSLRYGEGKKAFLRLQREIIKVQGDQSLFAWIFGARHLEELGVHAATHSFQQSSPFGLLADGPRSFLGCGQIISHHPLADDSEIREFNGSLQLTMSIVPIPLHMRLFREPEDSEFIDNGQYHIGLLSCGIKNQPEYLIGILLHSLYEEDQYARECLHLYRNDTNVPLANSPGLFTFLVYPREAADSDLKQIRIVGKDNFRTRYKTIYNTLAQAQYSFVLDTLLLNRSHEFHSVLPDTWKCDPTRSSLTYTDKANALPARMAIAWYNREERHMLCVLLDKLLPSVPYIEVDILSIAGVADDALSETLQRIYLNGKASFQDRWKNGHSEFEAHISRKKVSHHLVWTLLVKGGDRRHRFLRWNGNRDKAIILKPKL